MVKKKLSKKEQARVERHLDLDKDEHYVGDDMWLDEEQKKGIEELIEIDKVQKKSIYLVIFLVILGLSIWYLINKT